MDTNNRTWYLELYFTHEKVLTKKTSLMAQQVCYITDQMYGMLMHSKHTMVNNVF